MPTPKKKAAKKLKKASAKKSTKKIAPKKGRATKPKSRSITGTVSRSAGAAPGESTTLDTLYIIDGSDNNVTLAVKVGDKGQTSDMTIKLNDKVITENHAGDLDTTVLGTNKMLDGKKLSVVATIADTSRETNLTSLKIQIKGGMDPVEFPLSKTVEEEGASADYLCLIEFFKP
ncbi:MAG: hypothetical protein QM768_10090 [Agriterribacter sp.]